MGEIDDDAYWILDYYCHRNLDALALAAHCRRGLKLILTDYEQSNRPSREFRERPFVQDEVDAGYPLVSGQLTIALRANLETFCEEFETFLRERAPEGIVQDPVDGKRWKTSRLLQILPAFRIAWNLYPDAQICLDHWREARNQLAHWTGFPDPKFHQRHPEPFSPDARRIVSADGAHRFADVGVLFAALACRTFVRSVVGAAEDTLDAIESWLEGNQFLSARSTTDETRRGSLKQS